MLQGVLVFYSDKIVLTGFDKQEFGFPDKADSVAANVQILPYLQRQDWQEHFGMGNSENGADTSPTPGPFTETAIQASTFLTWHNKRYFGILCSEELSAPHCTVREALALLDEEGASLVRAMLAQLNWRASLRYCPACAAPLQAPFSLLQPQLWQALAQGFDAIALAESNNFEATRQSDLDHDQAGLTCTQCGKQHFPRISPAVIVLVEKAGTMLLAHNRRFPEGRFSCIAGFVDPGESLEDTVRREVMEEASIEIDSVEYKASQSWPFPDSLMLALTAQWKSGTPTPDGREISEVAWFSPDMLPQLPPRGSVSRALIEAFLQRQRRQD